jgi:oligoribonuclease (3'-5' exoribonuclease)
LQRSCPAPEPKINVARIIEVPELLDDQVVQIFQDGVEIQVTSKADLLLGVAHVMWEAVKRNVLHSHKRSSESYDVIFLANSCPGTIPICPIS